MNKKLIRIIFPVFLLSVLFLNMTFICSSAASALSITKQPVNAVAYVGDTVSLSVNTSGGSKLYYQWYSCSSKNTTTGLKISGATSSTYSPPTANIGSYYYYCIVYSTLTSIRSDRASVVVKALPKINTQPTDFSVYTGESAVLSLKATGSGTLHYQWYSNTKKSTENAVKITDAVSSSYTAPTAVSGTTYYLCVVTNTDSTVTTTADISVMSSIVKVAVSTLSTTTPTITSQPTSMTVYAGTPTQLSVTAAASGTLSYQWYSSTSNSTANSAAIADAKSSKYTVPTVTGGTLYYYCVVTNTATASSESQMFSTTSTIVPCTVKAATALTLQPVGTKSHVGDTVTLTVTATANSTPSYQWYKSATNSSSSGSKITGATSASYAVPTTAAGTAYYYCIVTSTDSTITGTAKSSAATSTVAQVVVLVEAITAPVITLQPAPATIYAGTAKKLSVTASGTGTLTYQWYTNTENNSSTGTAISNAVSSTYSVSSIAAGTTYFYCVVNNTAVTDLGKQSLSTVSTIASMSVKPLPVITSEPTDSSLCSGGSLTLSVSATGSGTLSYQWYKNPVNKTSGTKISGATGSTYTVKAGSLGTTSYYCVVTNTDSRITETIKTAAATSRRAIVTVVSADADSPKITKQPSKATVVAGLTTTLSVTATGNGTLSYQWYSNTKQSSAGSTLIIGATNLSYSPPTSTAGKVYYSCRVTNTDTSKTQNQSASVSTGFVLVIVNAREPAIVKQPLSAYIYIGDGYSLNVSATGCGALSYQWYSGTSDDISAGTPITGAVRSKFLVPSNSVDTIYYYCIVSNTVKTASGTIAGTTATDVACIDIVSGPSITAQPVGMTLNGGDSATVSVAASGNGKLTYQWYSASSTTAAGVALKNATTASYTFTTKAASATMTTYYYCIVTATDNTMTLSHKATVKSTSAAITVNAVDTAAPTITKKPISQTLKVGDSATLAVTANGSGTLSYQWYSNTRNSTAGATLISGATGLSFTLPTTAARTTYYYCVITNTDNSMSRTKTASATSAIARIVVKSV